MNRREEILGAVLDIFRSKGMNGDFTMTELASKLDIGKSTIYEYFKTKDEILSNALMHMIELSTNAILNRTNDISNLTFEEAFKAELSYLFTLAEDSHLLMEAISPKKGPMIPENCKGELKARMREVSKDYKEKFGNIFLKGIEEGLFLREFNEYDEALITSLVAGSIVRFSNKDLNYKNMDMLQYVDKIYESVILLLNN